MKFDGSIRPKWMGPHEFMVIAKVIKMLILVQSFYSSIYFPYICVPAETVYDQMAKAGHNASIISCILYYMYAKS
jgi:hypothetical protein